MWLMIALYIYMYMLCVLLINDLILKRWPLAAWDKGTLIHKRKHLRTQITWLENVHSLQINNSLGLLCEPAVWIFTWSLSHASPIWNQWNFTFYNTRSLLKMINDAWKTLLAIGSHLFMCNAYTLICGRSIVSFKTAGICHVSGIVWISSALAAMGVKFSQKMQTLMFFRAFNVISILRFFTNVAVR